MTPLPEINLQDFFDAILKGIVAEYGQIKFASAYERISFGATEDKKTPLPAIALELVDAPATTDAGTEQQAFTLNMDLRLICTARGGAAEAVRTRMMALSIASFLKDKCFEQPINGIRIGGVYPDYIQVGGDDGRGQNNASFIECQRINIEADAFVGQNVWEFPTENVELVWGDGIPTDEYYPKQ